MRIIHGCDKTIYSCVKRTCILVATLDSFLPKTHSLIIILWVSYTRIDSITTELYLAISKSDSSVRKTRQTKRKGTFSFLVYFLLLLAI